MSNICFSEVMVDVFPSCHDVDTYPSALEYQTAKISAFIEVTRDY